MFKWNIYVYMFIHTYIYIHTHIYIYTHTFLMFLRTRIATFINRLNGKKKK